MIYLACMFTGIIETTGIVKQVTANGSNKTFWIESGISSQLKIDQSLSHNGVCLTIEEIRDENHRVTAVDETLRKTNLHTWQVATIVNLEQCLQINDRLDGHIIQGHVDTVGTCIRKKEREGSWEFDFEFPKKFAPLIIEKGSICINGISLTAFNVKKKSFSVAIIPYTFEHTGIKQVYEGNKVNLEFDMIGKHVYRCLNLK